MSSQESTLAVAAGLVPCCPLLPCPSTNGYARAKLANLLHVNELQRRVDEIAHAERQHGTGHKFRRFVSSVLHPGSVSTGIHPFLSSKITSGVLRSPKEASKVVMYALTQDSFVPGSYIDSMAKVNIVFALFYLYLLAYNIHMALFRIPFIFYLLPCCLVAFFIM